MFPSWFDRLANLKSVLALLVGFSVLHGVVTMAAGPVLALDDDKLNIFTQSFQLGYLPDNPPLFEWTLIAVQKITGPVQLSFIIVKYLFLILTGLFTYLTAARLFKNHRWAAFTVLALLSLYQIGYNYHQAFTHSTALMASVAFLWYGLLKLRDEPRTQHYLLLGLAVGPGAIAKYSFLPVVVSIFIAGMLSSQVRARLLNVRILISVLLAMLVCLPHGLWLLDHMDEIAMRADQRFGTVEASYMSRVSNALPAALWAMGSFLLPFVAVVAVAAPNSFRELKVVDEATSIFRNATLVCIIVLLVGIVVTGASSFPERYAIAFMYPALFWFIAALKNSTPTERALRNITLAGFVFFGLFLGVRIVQTVMPGPPFCSDCRQWIPYAVLEDAFPAENFEKATLVGFDIYTAGNLRRLFPDNRVVAPFFPFYTPPGGDEHAPCYFVWSENLGVAPPDEYLPPEIKQRAAQITGKWPQNIANFRERETTWNIVDLKPNPRVAKSLCRLSGQ
ncbi:MAG: glycosyl transferase [Hyphococcus sp.]|nr:MAG: glycosyl transferase [Marinicaulis sp.]